MSEIKKKWIFIETDDSCAICGYPHKEDLTIHHIDHNPANTVYENEIVLCRYCHDLHHKEKKLTTEQIEDRKLTLMSRTITTYGINAIKKAYRNGEKSVVGMPFLLNHLVDLGYMEMKEEIEFYGSIPVSARFILIDRGRKVHDKWLRRIGW
jgi:hypothetical protein